MIHRVMARRIVYRDLKPENVSSSDVAMIQMDGSLTDYFTVCELENGPCIDDTHDDLP